MANIRISQLPTAPSAITGSELVPIVQNGQTVQTTVSAITSSPSLTQTFLTVTAQSSLPNSRYIGTGLGLGSSDGGSGGIYRIFLNGVSGSLENASQGIIVKNTGTTVVNRTLTVSGSGLSISNGDGISGNPTFALTGLVQALATTGGTGLLQTNGTTISVSSIAGTSNQISVANGNTNPIIGLASNPIIPGTASITLPIGNTAARPASPVNGMIRYNTDSNALEIYAAGNWGTVVSGAGVGSFSAGTTGFTPNTAISGNVVLAGILNVSNGGTGASTLTGYVYGNGTSPCTSSATIPTTDLSGTISNAQLANSTITIGSTSVSLGGTITTLAGVTINGSTNTLTNIANASLVNSSLTVGTTTISLGSTSLTLAGLTTVTVTQDPTQALQLATKQYVDAVAQGLDAKASVVNASTVAFTVTYNNGTAGVGATLTNAGSLAAFAADGVTNSVGDRVLIKNQAAPAQNGIYTVTTAGSGSIAWVLTRSTDMNTWTNVPNAYVWVESGSTQADTGWVCTSNAGGTMGTTAITWVQFSGAGTYTAGTGLTLTGTQFSITNTAVTAASYGSASSVATFTVNAQGQLTLAASTSIAIAASQVTSGTLAVAQGGTGVGTLTGLAYGNGTSAFTAATAAQVVSVIGTTAVTNATNAANVTLSAGSGATNYLVYAATATGSVPEYTSTGLTYNATNTAITGGINGGTF